MMSEADNNKASRVIEAIYDGLLDSLLRTYRWSFAIKRVELAALTEVPTFEYQYAYQLPSDCLRIDSVSDQILDTRFRQHANMLLHKPLWQREGDRIVSDIEAPLYLKYGARISDPSTWDSSFSEAFACLLAVEMCESITQSSTKKQAALTDFDTAIKAARQASAIERPPIQQQETSWFTSRL